MPPSLNGRPRCRRGLTETTEKKTVVSDGSDCECDTIERSDLRVFIHIMLCAVCIQYCSCYFWFCVTRGQSRAQNKRVPESTHRCCQTCTLLFTTFQLLNTLMKLFFIFVNQIRAPGEFFLYIILYTCAVLLVSLFVNKLNTILKQL